MPEELPKGILGFRGHPTSAKNDIDYDAKHIRVQAFASHADYCGPDEYNKGLYWLEFPDCSQLLESINGLSGSPVFQYALDDRDVLVAKWAGLMIAGTVESRKAQFIGAHVVHQSLIQMGL